MRENGAKVTAAADAERDTLDGRRCHALGIRWLNLLNTNLKVRRTSGVEVQREAFQAPKHTQTPEKRETVSMNSHSGWLAQQYAPEAASRTSASAFESESFAHFNPGSPRRTQPRPDPTQCAKGAVTGYAPLGTAYGALAGSGSLTTYVRAPVRPSGSEDASACFSYALAVAAVAPAEEASGVDAAAEVWVVGVAEDEVRNAKGE